MKWQFSHSNLGIDEESSKVNSVTTVTINVDGTEIKLYESVCAEEHVVGTKKALVDSGNLLRRIGLEMLRKADKIK